MIKPTCLFNRLRILKVTDTITYINALELRHVAVTSVFERNKVLFTIINLIYWIFAFLHRFLRTEIDIIMMNFISFFVWFCCLSIIIFLSNFYFENHEQELETTSAQFNRLHNVIRKE